MGITESFLSGLPYRLALAGGWIDQPFISQINPTPPGSMVVVCLQPKFLFMERAGMGLSTRYIALKLWGNQIPKGEPHQLMRDLYWAENSKKLEPSGSQDMAGLVFPGISRLDYDYEFTKGLFPIYVESCLDPVVAKWLELNLYMLPVMQRPPKYNPLGIKNLDPTWISRLGQSGKDCFDAVKSCDLEGLGNSMNECMACWEAILPHTVSHETIKIDLVSLLRVYQHRYPGAMYSGCGGGYLIVASDVPVPGGFQVGIHTQ